MTVHVGQHRFPPKKEAAGAEAQSRGWDVSRKEPRNWRWPLGAGKARKGILCWNFQRVRVKVPEAREEGPEKELPVVARSLIFSNDQLSLCTALLPSEGHA